MDAATEINAPLAYLNYPLNSTCCKFPDNFPSYVYDEYFSIDELRLSEQTATKDNGIEVIFSTKKNAQVTSIINIVRSIFVTLLLIFSSLLFIQDIETFALHPL